MSVDHSKRRAIALLAGLAGAAVALAGCSAEPGGIPGESAGGPSVPFGAPVEEWQAAFEELDPLEIVWQTSNPAATQLGEDTQAAADWIEELSGGKIQVEVAYSDSIAPVTEGLEGLQDGRLDLYGVGTFLRPADFPIAGVFSHETAITRGPTVVRDTLVAYGAIREALWATPEVVQEFEDKGLHMLNPLQLTGQNILACSQPLTSMADLQGKQIRVASTIQASQVEAMGGVPVTVAFPDLYESLQRGIVDCLIIGLSTMYSIPGMTELAPYFINPTGAAFGINAWSTLFGGRWSELPLAAQQLIYDAVAKLEISMITTGPLVSVPGQIEMVQAAGGDFLEFDDDVNQALAALKEQVVAAWSESTLLDGADFTERLDAAYEKWAGLVAEAGVQEVPFTAVDDWFEGYDPAAIEEVFFQDLVVPHRPA